jgi:enolase
MVEKITGIVGWEALDSRGNPTVAIQVEIGNSHSAVCLAPAGASAGSFEAKFLRDGSAVHGGKSVRGVITRGLPLLHEALLSRDAGNPEDIHDGLRSVDQTEDWSHVGGNMTTAVTIASWLAYSRTLGKEPWQVMSTWMNRQPTLPRPMVNIISGGAHAGKAIDIQDVLVIPVNALTVEDAIESVATVRREAASLVSQSGYSSSLVADEGGLAAPFTTNSDAIALVAAAIDQSSRVSSTTSAIALDVAANEFRDSANYRLDGESITSAELVATLDAWVTKWPIISIEDPLAEDDDWSLVAPLCEQIQIVGDDRYATSAARVYEGATRREANSVLIKPNQAGSLWQAMAALRVAVDEGWSTIVSARSGDTEESWLVDLAVGAAAGQIKVGSTHRSERTAKWNRMLELSATTTLPYGT